MGDLDGRTFVVTGANTGIGRVTAEALAKRGGKVILACRSEDKARPVVDAIVAAGGDAAFHALDLADLAATRRSAERLLAKDEPIHVLVNNAGLAGKRGQTKDGFELTFGTNHLGPFLFTRLLLPRLRESRPARVVNVSSGSHYGAHAIPWAQLRESTRSLTGIPEYNVSKLCQVLFTKSLARGEAGEGVTSSSLHPGTMIATDIWRTVPSFARPVLRLFMMPLEDGAKTTLHCATDPDVPAHDGDYWTDCELKAPNPIANDVALQDELWRRCEEWTR
ncbi:MAG: SDR family oxidoreductase [Labilithrix sp.]|nr:SDR family oxidoreductase [Labilithrix sp.]MCW5809683.1 SDR family oxidoreductase [Labilithrix sp.]